MGRAVSEILPYAVGVAIVPIPIIAVILMLFSRRARTNGPLFALGWVVGLTVAFGVLYALVGTADPATDSSGADAVSWGSLLLGLALLFLALRTWRARPAVGEPGELPGWLDRVDDLAPAWAVVFGLLLAAANPKNLLLIAGAASGLAGSGVSTGDAAVALVVFVVVASLSVLGPVVYFFLGGDEARVTLEGLREWLAANAAAVTTVLLLVLGVLLVARALGSINT